MFHKRQKNGVHYLVSDMISAGHAFSTRRGGVSTLPHTREMNFALDKGDTDECVLENYKRFADATGICDNRAYGTQIHGREVVYAKCGGFMGKCDGLYTNQAGIALTVKTADCIPMLLEDAKRKIIGAVHAGWRGSAESIATECVSKMEELGADREEIRIAIGPFIHECCFEVRDDLIDVVRRTTGLDEAVFIKRRDNKTFADLAELNIRLLTNAGIPRGNIDVCPLCTACDTDTFFYSHRKMGSERGIMCAQIALC